MPGYTGTLTRVVCRNQMARSTIADIAVKTDGHDPGRITKRIIRMER